MAANERSPAVLVLNRVPARGRLRGEIQAQCGNCRPPLRRGGWRTGLPLRRPSAAAAVYWKVPATDALQWRSRPWRSNSREWSRSAVGWKRLQEGFDRGPLGHKKEGAAEHPILRRAGGRAASDRRCSRPVSRSRIPVDDDMRQDTDTMNRYAGSGHVFVRSELDRSLRPKGIDGLNDALPIASGAHDRGSAVVFERRR